jgi:hypothetical protein
MSKVIDLHKEIECQGEFPEMAVQKTLRDLLAIQTAQPEQHIFAQDAIEEWE